MATPLAPIPDPEIFSVITPVEYAEFFNAGIYEIGPAVAEGALDDVGIVAPCFLPPPLEGVIPEIDLLTNVDPGFTVDGSIGEILADGFALLG